MRRPKRILEKKYISTLVIAAFLILSVLTANNIRMGDTNTKESDTETKETISQAGNKRNDSIGNDNSSGNQDEPDDSSSSEQKSKKQEEKTGVVERDTEDHTSKNNSETQEGNTDRDESDHFHFNELSRLTWPVLGNVILPYSMDTTVYYTTLDQYACSDGILIGARVGDEVRAAADGRVVNVSESDRYGTMVTVLIGDYYELYYAQVDNVKCNIGDEINEGDIIGTVAEPTRSFLLEGPHLFFKMTRKGECVNPAEYLK